MTKQLDEIIEEKANSDGLFAIAYAVLQLVDAQYATAKALNKLGVAEASTPFGAIEAHSMSVQKVADALADISGALGNIQIKARRDSGRGTLRSP
jgi:hypothetical protein